MKTPTIKELLSEFNEILKSNLEKKVQEKTTISLAKYPIKNFDDFINSDFLIPLDAFNIYHYLNYFIIKKLNENKESNSYYITADSRNNGIVHLNEDFDLSFELKGKTKRVEFTHWKYNFKKENAIVFKEITVSDDTFNNMTFKEAFETIKSQYETTKNNIINTKNKNLETYKKELNKLGITEDDFVNLIQLRNKTELYKYIH